MAERLANKDKVEFSHMKSFLKLRLQFSIIRSVAQCLRGKRDRKSKPRPEDRDTESADIVVEESGILRGAMWNQERERDERGIGGLDI